jgi:excisionase family DNA binding protein
VNATHIDDLQESISDNSLFISYPKAAALVSTSMRTLRRLSAEGRLPCYRVGPKRVLRIKTRDVVALIERGA